MLSDHSDHTKKIDRSRVQIFFTVFGVIGIAGLLAAMAILTDGEVRKAESRKSQLTTQRVALAQCFENAFGTASSNCTREVHSVDSVKFVSGSAVDNNLMAQDGMAIGAVEAVVKVLATIAK